MGETPHPAAEQQGDARYRALLDISETLSAHLEMADLFPELGRRLRSAVSFDFVAFVLHQQDTGRMALRLVDTGGLELPFPASVAVEESAAGWVWQNQKPLLYGSLEGEARFGPVLSVMRQAAIRSCSVLPLTTAAARLGALVFGCKQPDAYSPADLEFLLHVAQQVAVAIENAANRHASEAYQKELAAERDRLQTILALNNVLASQLDPHDLFPQISAAVRGLVAHDYCSLALYDPAARTLRLHALVFPAGKGLVHEEFTFPIEGAPGGWVVEHRRPLLLEAMDLTRFPSEIARRMHQEGVRSALFLPLETRNGFLGTLSLASLQPQAFTPADVDLMERVARQVSIAVDNALAFHQIAELKDKLASERLYLEEEIRTQYNFEEIVGESGALKNVLQQVQTVAPTQASVLILGETGTGKELIARSIHNLSPRSERTFVKLSIAAIPTGLLESELFGHQKGAFTGALAQKLGRFELAHQGTLFLDEVGEIPLELQPKLLRALQEHEFERLGSTRTQKVDARVVAATNRDLSHMVAEGTFRSDLFYRLNVFPIHVPPLRERPSDIPLLVRYFAQKFSRAMDRRIEIIPAETMQALLQWRWPGNIRELSNLIERSVILSSGPVLQVPLAELRSATSLPENSSTTLEANEREHILRVLRETKGVIAGPNGAAERLGLKRTTLNFKMKKLGIRRQDI